MRFLAQGGRKLKGRKLKEADIRGRRKLKGIRYILFVSDGGRASLSSQTRRKPWIRTSILTQRIFQSKII